MKYLTHNFIPHILINNTYLISDSYSICDICGVIIISKNNELTSIPPYISNAWNKTPGIFNIQLTLTCNEIIIKTALE